MPGAADSKGRLARSRSASSAQAERPRPAAEQFFAGADDKAGRPARRGIQSIEIGFRILDHLRMAPRPLPLKAIAAGTGMSAANVHYYLVSFQAVGIVRQEEDTGCYALGPYALKLGLAAMEQFDVFTAARPAMTDLAEEIGQTVFLGVWGNRGPTIIYRVEAGGNRPILELRVGSVLPLLRSALGRNFVAHLPPAFSEELVVAALKEERTRHEHGGSDDTPRDRGELETMLASIRAAGISRCRDALLANFMSLSAPILDQTGLMIAAITLMGPIGTMDDDLTGPIAEALRSRAAAISKAAGWGD